MKKILITLISTSIFILANSCSILESKPLEITGWSPSESSITDTSGLIIKVSFSEDPVRTSAEEAFTLTSEGVEVPGSYIWIGGNTLEYRLYHDLDKGADYTLKVSTQAEDSNGNSLKKDFIFNFTTKTTTGRPKLSNIAPADFSVINNNYENIVMLFDKEMNPESVVDQFSITPPVTGHFTWNSSLTEFTFNPSDPYTWQDEYIVTMGSETSDSDGWNLGYEFTSHFEVGVDKDPPEVLSVSDDTESYYITLDNPDDAVITVTRNWEKNRNISIQFSEKMDQESVEGALTIEPQSQWTNTWTNNIQGDRLTMTWSEPLLYNTSYSLRISDSAKDFYSNRIETPVTYNFMVDGGSSKPPELVMLKYITNEAPLQDVVLYDRDNPANNKVEYRFSDIDKPNDVHPVFFDFYFDLGDNCYIDQFLFMENYAILPGSEALTYTPDNIIAQTSSSTPTYTGSVSPDLLSGYIVVRLQGKMNDSNAAIGMVEFKIYKDFADTNGNKMTEDWHWQVFDVDTP